MNDNGTGSQKGKTSSGVENYLLQDTKSLKDYILLFRNHLKYIVIISMLAVILASAYAFKAKNIYTSTASVRITSPYKNVLENGRQNLDNTIHDRYIISEMGVIGNFATRTKIAGALIDSFEVSKKKDLLPLIASGKGSTIPKSVVHVAALLGGMISVEQNKGTDVVFISAESLSPYEASLVANCTAKEYQKLNTIISREKLTSLRKFLEEQAQVKLMELRAIEDSMMKFQEKGGIISFDVQSSSMIGQLANLDAQKEAIKIDLMTSNEMLKQYKSFLKTQDPRLVEYLEGQTSQAYITALQQEIAQLQVNRDIAMSIKSPRVDVSLQVQEYNSRIADIKEKLDATISSIKSNAFSGSPEQVRDLAQKLIEEEIRNSSLTVQLEQLEAATGKYERELRRLPQASTVLSQYQREREALQQTYLLLNERFQEAMIHEASETGNVVILNPAVVPDSPAKPNRVFIIMIGLILGPILSLALILIKDHFDDSVKTPDDIQKEEINFLSWVPHFKSNGKGKNLPVVVLDEQNSPISESFRVIKARIQQPMNDSELMSKTVLITSPAENEGKSFVAVNLAGSFSLSNKKTVLVDCDLRRPTVNLSMGVDKKPGLSDYISHKANLDEIIRRAKTPNLSFITSGTIPSNPAEMFESKAFKDFIHEIRGKFEIIILDSPPIVAVIDSEILAKYVNGTVLVISADKTEKRLMRDAVDLLKRNKTNFLGVVLNNFRYKSGYGYYYKYYYSYSSAYDQKSKKRKS